jgi:hypothetical protein
MGIYDDNCDRKLWLETLDEACENFCTEATTVPEPSRIGGLAQGGGLL